jgi:hypothetical protein
MAKPIGELTFAPLPRKFGVQWHVIGTYPNGQEEHITGFKTEASALDWIANEFPKLAEKAGPSGWVNTASREERRSLLLRHRLICISAHSYGPRLGAGRCTPART